MGTILTVGHGTLTAAAFAELVRGAGVDVVVDVHRRQAAPLIVCHVPSGRCNGRPRP